MSFGLTAKERMAQLQAKGAKDPPPPKAGPANGVKKLGAAAAAGKDAAKPGDAKKPEPAKPKEEPKKPEAAKPSPADASKPGAAKKDEAKPPDTKKPEVKEEPKKPEAAKPKEEPKAPEKKEEAKKPEPGKPKEEAKTPEAKPEEKPAEPAKPAKAAKPAEPAAKPAAEPPKADAKPKEEAKPAEPAKQKEEPKKPETKPAAEPAKPAGQQKAPELAKPAEAKPVDKPADKPAATAPAAAKEPDKPKEAAKPAGPEKPKQEPPKPEAKPPAEKPKVEEKKPTPAEAGKPAAVAAAQPAKPAATEPAKAPATEPAKPAADKPATEEVKKKEPVKPPTDMIGSIFYFSGMGSLLGSALAEGIYVPESGQRSALDADIVESAGAKRRAISNTDQVVVTARNQAQVLSTDFRNLQALLESVPTFGEALQAQPLDRRGVDQPIHGHVYFRQSDHVLQAPPTRQSRAHGGQDAHPPPGAPSYAGPAHLPPGAQQVFPATEPVHHHVPVDGSYPHQQHPPPGHAPAPAPAPPAPSHWAPPPPQPSKSPHFDPHPAPPRHQPAPPAPQPMSHADYGLETPSQPWQDRYGPGGRHATDTARSPRPFGSDRAAGSDVDAGGVKPWQMSHLRGLEAKGYRLVTEPEHSDANADASSYAPYLVSDRSFNVDRQKTLSRSIDDRFPTAPSPYDRPTPVQQPAAFRPHSTGPTLSYPFAPGVESTMPYCDL